MFTALYCEAHLFIKEFQLEKIPESTRFQQFYNETSGIRLTITGVGEIAAAAAVSSVCTKYGPKEEDMLFNVGTCAYRKGSGGVFLCNKIIEQATGKTFYPDILYRHAFKEKTIVTGMEPFDVVGMQPFETDEHCRQAKAERLYDMEAAAVYQAGSYFFGPHQMVFLKAVSDEGRAGSVSARQVEALLEGCGEPLIDFIRRFSRQASEGEREYSEKEHLVQKSEELFKRLCTDMHCSKAMGDLLKQYLRYLSLAGVDYASVVQSMYREGLLPCKDKREGKLCFEEFKRRLL